MAEAVPHHCRAVRVWLFCVAALVFAMVLVGGATRLTESGLSIVEWKPVTGALPPLSQSDWQAEFNKYRTIPQAQTVNRGMTLDAFKTIYWWEWTHRLLGRVIGFVFLLPLLWFLARGAIKSALRSRLWLIFGLGAFQGAVGWWMVASGLSGRTSVSQYRLAFHLTLACIIYAALLWTAQAVKGPPRPSEPAVAPRLRWTATALLALVFVQIYLGALVAGLDAGLVSNTWPLIDGAFVPSSDRLLFLQPLWRNAFENELTAQFDHRMVAYALWAVAVLHAFDAWRMLRRGAVARGALVLAAAVTVQAALGISAVLESVPLGLALTHQAMAMVTLTLAVLHAQNVAVRGAMEESQGTHGASASPGHQRGRPLLARKGGVPTTR